jgi:hypothetical protein
VVAQFLVRPHVPRWRLLRYYRWSWVRGRSVPGVPDGAVGEWHALTRLTHVLVHDPSGSHAHLLGNVVLLGGASAALYWLARRRGTLDGLASVYLVVAVTTALAESVAFEWFGSADVGFGASGVAFGVVGLATALAALHLWTLGGGVRRPLLAAVGLVAFGASALAGRGATAGTLASAALVGRRRVSVEAAGQLDRPVALGVVVLGVGLLAGDALFGTSGTVAHQTGFLVGTLVGVGWGTRRESAPETDEDGRRGGRPSAAAGQ